MIILMIAIGILLVAVGIIIDIKTDSLEMGVMISAIGGAHAILWILPCIFVGIAISSGTTLEEKNILNGSGKFQHRYSNLRNRRGI